MNKPATATDDAYWRDVINPGDRASALAKEICFRSHSNSSLVHVIPHQPGNFRGAVGFIWRKDILEKMMNHRIENGAIVDWEMTEEVENDGAGGKPQFLTLNGDVETFRGLGWEIIAMTADDFARTGRYPVVIDNEINVQRITEKNFQFFQATMEGYGEALKKARLVNITGETAIMRHSITAFCDHDDDTQLILTWGASCIGLCECSKLIDGSKIGPGMSIIGLFENGYRCNGGTFFTKLIQYLWHKGRGTVQANPEAREFVHKLTVPSVSYASFIGDLQGWRPEALPPSGLPDIRGIAHITGGGVWGKFKEILPKGVGANLDHMPDPPSVLLEAQRLSEKTPYKLSDWQAYSTLHGGCGMLIVCTPESVRNILAYARFHRIGAALVGETTSSDTNEVLIRSRFSLGETESSEYPR